MRINFKREGEYAKIPIEYDANADELSKDTADRLLEMVETSGVWRLSQESGSATIGFSREKIVQGLTKR